MTSPVPTDPFDTDSPSTTPLYSPVTATNIYHAVTDLGYPPEYVTTVARALDEFQLAISAANDGHFLLDQLAPQADRFEVLDVDRISDRTRLEDLLFFSGPYAKTILTDAIGIAMPEFEGPATGHPYPMSPSSFGVDDDHLQRAQENVTDDDPDGAGDRNENENRRPRYGFADMDIDEALDIDFTISSLDEDRLLPGIHSQLMRAEVQQIVELAFAYYRTEPGLMNELDPVVGCTFAVRSAPHDDIVMAEPGPRTVPLPGGTRVA
ncbi:hypothetical protein N0B31_21655 (plasmid) [Salinirubellus salinus]|uniref:Uncharacterized protein n=1 Tax=Salinirubellus salinus TaxID=1364945 RepID=A0A9E7R6X8_9EURY|nr:hypothetical protein [Salinirubellus salinus]UWM57012.1 hypothetical protein N0B31_22460 [Salinirubellus salinus]UWM57050.1 hypothetical protein N0B31_21655 [Salinirubellus salinus]